MGKLEFVSFNKEAPNKETCFGKMVFMYNGTRYETMEGFINQRNRLDVCHNTEWTEQDIDWPSLNIKVSEEDRFQVLKMVRDNVVPVLSKCDFCSKLFEPCCEVDSLEHQIDAILGRKRRNC